MDSDTQFIAKVLGSVFPKDFVGAFVAEQKGLPWYIDQVMLWKQLLHWAWIVTRGNV